MFVNVVYLMVCFDYSNVIEQLIYLWLTFHLETKQSNDEATIDHHYSSSSRVYWSFSLFTSNTNSFFVFIRLKYIRPRKRLTDNASNESYRVWKSLTHNDSSHSHSHISTDNINDWCKNCASVFYPNVAHHWMVNINCI